MSHWNGTLYNWEVIDEYCDENAADIDDILTVSSIRGWMYQKGFVGFDASVCLSAHRRAVDRRRYTLERIGWGPNTYHRVVRTPFEWEPDAITSRSEQQFDEAIKHWKNEYRYGMKPLAQDRKGRRILAKAEARFYEAFRTIRAEADLELEANGLL